jgi:hypothetical protein
MAREEAGKEHGQNRIFEESATYRHVPQKRSQESLKAFVFRARLLVALGMTGGTVFPHSPLD